MEPAGPVMKFPTNVTHKSLFQTKHSKKRKMGKMKIPLLDTKGHMSDKVGRALMCNGQEGIEDILKARGWKPEAGPALVLMAMVKEGKVQGMKLVTIGDNITVTWEMEHLWQGFTKVNRHVKQQEMITAFYFQGIFCEATLRIDQLEFPASGASPRNASEWISEADVNRSYYRFEGKEKVSASLMYNTL